MPHVISLLPQPSASVSPQHSQSPLNATEPTRDWDNIKEFGNAYHPLAGYYKSDERVVLRQQLHWMRRAGIDLIVYDAYSTRKMNQKGLAEDTTLQLLVEALANQEAESHKLQLCIWLETYLGNPTLEEYDFALNHVREQLSKHSFYYRYEYRYEV